MIARLLRWLWRKTWERERSEYLREAKGLLDEARGLPRREYITYERYDIDSEAFLYGIFTAIENPRLISWLNEHKLNCLAQMRGAMAARDNEGVLRGMAQITMIDSLFMDIDKFRLEYQSLLERKAAGE